jgi:VanZ family protein
MRQRSRRILLAAVPPGIYMILVFVLSSRRVPDAVEGLRIEDTWLHLVEYAVLGFLLARLLATIRGGDSPSFALVVILPALLSTLYGASDEWHQSFVPGRDASVEDLVMDAVGSLVGALAYWKVAGRSRRPTMNDATRSEL